MGPIRSAPNSSKSQRKQNFKDERSSPQTSVAGVQKIKSSLRQTRRLLAKDNLTPDVRIATERRVKSLEGDLAQAERSRKERDLALRYHKVKFFERRKICRKINHVKKLLDAPDTVESLSSLREMLFSYRVDLNYILNYPKTKKYISLFPPESSKTADGNTETDRQREELRQLVRTAMSNGEMDSEPEQRMSKGDVQDGSLGWPEKTSGTTSHGKKNPNKESPSKSQEMLRDTFFEPSDSSGGEEDGNG